MASSWILFFSYQDDARSKTQQKGGRHLHDSYRLRFMPSKHKAVTVCDSNLPLTRQETGLWEKSKF